MRRPRLFAQKRYRQFTRLEAVVNKTFPDSDFCSTAPSPTSFRVRGFIPDSYIRAGGRFSQMPQSLVASRLKRA